MSKYIILTGATGFVGSHLLNKLLNENKKVILLKRSFSNTWRIKNLITHSNLTLFNLDKENLTDIFTQYDIEGIFHLATSYIQSNNNKDISNMINANIEFPTILLNNGVNSGIKYFINTSTVYEYSQKKLPINENSNYEPLNFYATTKLSFETLLKYYTKEFNLNTVTLNLFTPYGPKDNESKLLPYIILQRLKNKKVILKNPNKYMDLIYINDVINAYMKLYDKISLFTNYSKFNIATGKNYQIKIIDKFIDSLINNYEFELESDFKYVETNKSKDILKWIAITSLEDGLNSTIEYYKQTMSKNKF